MKKQDKWKREKIGHWNKDLKKDKRSKGEKVICQYCDIPAKLVTGLDVYPNRKDLGHLKFWMCKCGAYVGCHKTGNGYGNGTRPFGTLANAELRFARSKAHTIFDKLWIDKGVRGRLRAYKWLGNKLGLAKTETHIGMFDLEKCKLTIMYCEELNEHS